VTPHYTDPWLTVYHGDARAVMAEMVPESVHCVVTSPPYWGLRDYGTAAWSGGDDLHQHVGSVMRTMPPGSAKQASNKGASAVASGDCACGATRVDGQLGLEPTPEEYVDDMVAVFREVRRVLRRDGTVWLNLGDSYAGGASGSNPSATSGLGSGPNGASKHRDSVSFAVRPPAVGLKPKDLVGIPWRVAFALQADGWYLRSDIIWAKPNPMPESVTDRPTKAHEYLFLLSKSPRYYYDADAVREPHTESTLNRIEYGLKHRHPADVGVGIPPVDTDRMGERFANPSGRNMRSVWTIATAPYPGAHFATFPPKLVEPCIKAGTSEKGVCPECGAPWVREVERVASTPQRENYHGNGVVPRHRGGVERAGGYYPEATTTGWRPSCGHVSPLPPWSATVLDPFAGSGTTGMVAQSLSRRAVLIDLSMDYLGQLMERNRDMPLGLSG
jgi:DNA modification methylase